MSLPKHGTLPRMFIGGWAEATRGKSRAVAEKKHRELRKRDRGVERGVVNVELLPKWSEEAGRKVEGAAPSEHAAELLRQRHTI